MHDAAIFLTEGTSNTGPRLFGKDVANAGLIRALVAAQLAASPDRPQRFCALDGRTPQDVARHFGLDAATQARLAVLRPDAIPDTPGVGVLMHGQPNIYHFAWTRRPEQARAYSLCGLIHTLAPPATQEVIAKVLTAPVQPWDALVCTSTAVLRTTTALLESWGDFIGARFGGARAPLPRLPVIPLGVDCDAFEPTPERRAAGQAWRDRLGIAGDDVAILWMGRLSFFEKMHPFATLAAAESAARRSRRKLHLVFAGWFPHDSHRAQYARLAAGAAPSVKVHFVDGNDPDVRAHIWFAADVFTSLVDNVQETFGLAPIEAMAAGLPVVASDWDGYKDTIPDGVAGFRIPTVLPPAGSGLDIVRPHASHIMSYQNYVGAVSQGIAVDVAAAADAFLTLAEDADRRRRFGGAGRERARTVYDWPVIAAQYRALWAELTEVRRAEAGVAHAAYPLHQDPYALFAGFATRSMDAGTVLALADADAPARLKPLRSLEINSFARYWHLDDGALRALLDRLAAGPLTLADLEQAHPGESERVQRSVAWLLKMGLVVLRAP
ncbi:glycosyltransferase family 4 protein [Azospirillum halopraeferens]|uniref:glycosyltransferase family 4 protein n=1 Tax=Azospirillum halopraeferens TaxID=34010 RepID=UPI0003FDF968|nr:glycosyltransferase family 4 protein [Azospirillum halopraeferens]